MQTQTQTKLGKLGATRQSWSRNSPRDVLKAIVDAHPRENESELLRIFTDEIRQNEAHVDAIIEYWFTNNLRSMRQAQQSPEAARQRAAERDAVAVAIKQKVEKVIERKAQVKAQVMMLSLVMPNGKALKDCTGRDCKELSTKVGPWLAALGKQLKPTQVVGKELSEAQVRKLYGAQG
jgi:hypothetical protein